MVAQGVWNDFDNCSWAASVIFGLYWLLPLTAETFLRFSFNLRWFIVIFALVLNYIKMGLLTRYLELLWLNGMPDEAGKLI